jgi:hypothetical protein
LFDAVRQEKGAIDLLWGSAGTAEEGKFGAITEGRRIRLNVLTPDQVVAPGQEQLFDGETKVAVDAREAFDPTGRERQLSWFVDGGTTAV